MQGMGKAINPGDIEARINDAQSCPVAAQTSAPAQVPLTLSLTRDLATIEDDWRRLEQCPASSPHQGYDWCRSWATVQGQEPLVIIGRQANQVVMMLPLEIVTRLGVRTARFPGGRFNNLNTGLFDPALQLSVHEQQDLADKIRHCLSGRADLLLLDMLPESWALHRHPLADLAHFDHPNASFQLPLLPSFEATLSQLNAKRRRKKFRTQTRRLEDMGGYELYLPATAQERHDLLDLFFAQKRIRFEAQGLPDAFIDPTVQRVFHALIDSEPRGRDHPLALQAIRLKAGGEGAIAAIAGITSLGDQIICQFGSIDESRVPDASPGELLFWLMIEKACAEGYRVFNFGIGDQLYKRSWCPVETRHRDIMIPISLIGRIATLGHVAASRATAAIKRRPLLYRRLQRLRSGQIFAARDNRPDPVTERGED